MSLLKRIAISNSDKTRKTAANKALAITDHHKVVKWNKILEAEANKKDIECSPLYISSILLTQGGKV